MLPRETYSKSQLSGCPLVAPICVFVTAEHIISQSLCSFPPQTWLAAQSSSRRHEHYLGHHHLSSPHSWDKWIIKFPLHDEPGTFLSLLSFGPQASPLPLFVLFALLTTLDCLFSQDFARCHEHSARIATQGPHILRLTSCHTHQALQVGHIRCQLRKLRLQV